MRVSFEWLDSVPAGELQSAVEHARHFAPFPISLLNQYSPVGNVLVVRGTHYGLCVPID